MTLVSLSCQCAQGWLWGGVTSVVVAGGKQDRGGSSPFPLPCCRVPPPIFSQVWLRPLKKICPHPHSCQCLAEPALPGIDQDRAGRATSFCPPPPPRLPCLREPAGAGALHQSIGWRWCAACLMALAPLLVLYHFQKACPPASFSPSALWHSELWWAKVGHAGLLNHPSPQVGLLCCPGPSRSEPLRCAGLASSLPCKWSLARNQPEVLLAHKGWRLKALGLIEVKALAPHELKKALKAAAGGRRLASLPPASIKAPALTWLGDSLRLFFYFPHQFAPY